MKPYKFIAFSVILVSSLGLVGCSSAQSTEVTQIKADLENYGIGYKSVNDTPMSSGGDSIQVNLKGNDATNFLPVYKIMSPEAYKSTRYSLSSEDRKIRIDMIGRSEDDMNAVTLLAKTAFENKENIENISITEKEIDLGFIVTTKELMPVENMVHFLTGASNLYNETVVIINSKENSFSFYSADKTLLTNPDELTAVIETAYSAFDKLQTTNTENRKIKTDIRYAEKVINLKVEPLRYQDEAEYQKTRDIIQETIQAVDAPDGWTIQ